MSFVCEQSVVCLYIYLSIQLACRLISRMIMPANAVVGAETEAGGVGGGGGVSATWKCQLLAVRATCAAQTLTLAPKLTCNSARDQTPDRVQKPKPSQSHSHSQVQTVIAACELTAPCPCPCPCPCHTLPNECVGVCELCVCIQVLCLHLLSLWRFSAKLSKFEHK